jgi:hypothetical protein
MKNGALISRILYFHMAFMDLKNMINALLDMALEGDN